MKVYVHVDSEVCVEDEGEREQGVREDRGLGVGVGRMGRL